MTTGIRTPPAFSNRDFDGAKRVVVVGGGLAGVAAATVLAERGVKVALLEQSSVLGGRVAAWTDRFSSGEEFEMERGFHAFFRQYYNVRSLLRRIDPDLKSLIPLEDYPLLGPAGSRESFAGLPKRAPFNVMGLVGRTRTLRLRDLPRIRPGALLDLFAFDAERTYERFDHLSAKEYLDSLRFPEEARRMLFEVFAHSFFNPEEAMSAAELLMMFHFYFTGNPEGLLFDVLKEPFSTAVWEPFRGYLEKLGVELAFGCTVERVERTESGSFSTFVRRHDFRGHDFRGHDFRDHDFREHDFRGHDFRGQESPIPSDAVILAVTVPALQQICKASPSLSEPPFARSITSLEVTLPFAVWRVWLDKPTAPGRAPFVGTAGLGVTDNISLFHLFEGESRRWAERTGGSVVEVHAYAVRETLDESAIRAEFARVLHELYPETANARILEERFLFRRDCPAFAPGSHAVRPTVRTTIPGLLLAGDFVRLPIPSALMERAAASGFYAANELLARWGLREENVRSIPNHGFLRLPKIRRRASFTVPVESRPSP